jgi:hypothetical protein
VRRRIASRRLLTQFAMKNLSFEEPGGDERYRDVSGC